MRDIQAIITDYWNCAYQQGLEYREHDDEKGTAQRLEDELQAWVAAHSTPTPPTYAQGQEDALTALGHVKVSHPRCQARYKETEQRASGPRNPPVWCDLPAGHEGPHRHVSGHRSFIMDREHLIEMKSLPDLCAKCGTVWPCQDVQTVLRALPIKEGE